MRFGFQLATRDNDSPEWCGGSDADDLDQAAMGPRCYIEFTRQYDVSPAEPFPFRNGKTFKEHSREQRKNGRRAH